MYSSRLILISYSYIWVYMSVYLYLYFALFQEHAHTHTWVEMSSSGTNVSWFSLLFSCTFPHLFIELTLMPFAYRDSQWIVEECQFNWHEKQTGNDKFLSPARAKLWVEMNTECILYELAMVNMKVVFH